MKTYLLRIGVALTQLLNTLLGGWPDESTSSRLWRMHLQGSRAGSWGMRAVDRLFGAGHCRDAYLAERRRYQLPPVLRG